MEKERKKKLLSLAVTLAACIPLNGSYGCAREWHVKPEVVGSEPGEGTWCVMWYHGLQAVGLMWGMEQQLSSPVSFLRGFEHAPQFEDLDINLCKEV